MVLTWAQAVGGARAAGAQVMASEGFECEDGIRGV